MNNDKLISAFSEALGVNKEKINDEYSYGDQGWDSVAHMVLIAAIEEAFDIMIDTDDVIDMSSFAKAKTIITKYGIDFNA